MRDPHTLSNSCNSPATTNRRPRAIALIYNLSLSPDIMTFHCQTDASARRTLRLPGKNACRPVSSGPERLWTPRRGSDFLEGREPSEKRRISSSKRDAVRSVMQGQTNTHLFSDRVAGRWTGPVFVGPAWGCLPPGRTCTDRRARVSSVCFDIRLLVRNSSLTVAGP